MFHFWSRESKVHPCGAQRCKHSWLPLTNKPDGWSAMKKADVKRSTVVNERSLPHLEGLPLISLIKRRVSVRVLMGDELLNWGGGEDSFLWKMKGRDVSPLIPYSKLARGKNTRCTVFETKTGRDRESLFPLVNIHLAVLHNLWSNPLLQGFEALRKLSEWRGGPWEEENWGLTLGAMLMRVSHLESFEKPLSPSELICTAGNSWLH